MRQELVAVLDQLGIVGQTTEHPPLHTVAESQALRGTIPGVHTKNLFVKDKKGRLFLVSAAESTPIDLKRLHTVVGAQGRLSFADADAMFATLGVRPGAVTPLGALHDDDRRVTIVLDAGLLDVPIVNCHPLRNTATISLRPADLLAFLRAVGHEPLIVALPAPSDGPESAA